MIIAKPYNTGDVVSFKLVGGEEIISRIGEETEASYKLTKPVSLVATPQGGLGMAPAMYSADLNSNNSIYLQKSLVIMHCMSRKEIADEYTRATSSIKPASSLAGVLNGKSST